MIGAFNRLVSVAKRRQLAFNARFEHQHQPLNGTATAVAVPFFRDNGGAVNLATSLTSRDEVLASGLAVLCLYSQGKACYTF